MKAWYQSKLGGNSEKGQCLLRVRSATANKGHRTPAEVTGHKDQFSEVLLACRQKLPNVPKCLGLQKGFVFLFGITDIGGKQHFQACNSSSKTGLRYVGSTQNC